MKIDNNRANFDRLEQARTEAVETTSRKEGAGKTGAVSGDTVSLSSGVQFASMAMMAATDAPEIRQDKVDRAKAMLADGTLGGDPVKLADALIERAFSKD